ncbi:MAG TPA: hypothetical protein VHX38_17250 [Pseudonocardiaceae bacterium]|jgi:hypothetical protein|nr:hypothetical protein [Pseudonocardiaceae bacterium]
MKTFALGVALGYVLGTRAGRERYDQLVQIYRTIVDHPLVQGAAGVARAKLGQRSAADPARSRT